MRYTDYAGGGSNGGESAVVEVDFTNANFPQLTLKGLVAGDRILEVVVKVITPFDPGASMSLGFPADTDEIAPASKIKLQKAGHYKFFPYRKTVSVETFNAYFSGSSAGGSGKIYFYS